MTGPSVPAGPAVLRAIVRLGPERLAALDPDGGQREPGGWSRREELGHLIDSAVNNHPRVLRMQLGETVLPGYDGELWVKLQQYATREWNDLIELWSAMNRHLLSAAERAPESSWNNRASIGGAPPETLAFVIDDYVRHLRSHLEHIGVSFADVAEIRDFQGQASAAR